MDKAEPIQLYATNAAVYSLVSWRQEASDESDFVAIPDRDGRRRIKFLPTGRSAGRTPDFAEGMPATGGVWTRVERLPERFSFVTRRFPTRDYQPPTHLVVLGRDGKIEYRPLDEEQMYVSLDQYVLLPVDSESQQQLDHWLTGIANLSSDLREATLLSILDGGLLDTRRLQEASVAALQQTGKRGSSGFPLWAWIVITAVLGLGIGGALGYLVLPGLQARFNPPKKSTAPATPPAYDPQSDIKTLADTMNSLEGTLKNSKRAEVRQLVETHVDPYKVTVEPPHDLDPALRIAEAWMVVKLVMLKTDGKIEPTWSGKSNEPAVEFINTRFAELEPADQSAIRTAFCYSGQTPPGDPAKCLPADWKNAAGLAAMADTIPAAAQKATKSKSTK